MSLSVIAASVDGAPPCPGFCGREHVINNTNSLPWTSCGACSWGSRSVDSRYCNPCNDDLSLYDWMYLGFMAFLPLLVHCFCVHWYSPRKVSRIHEISEHICCILECVISSIITVLIFPPTLSFRLFGCAKSSIKEWYPTLYVPILHHIKPMRCSYEVVFPLYSLPFVYMFFLLISILLLRSLLYFFVLKRHRDAKAYYFALLSLPKVAFVHLLMAGFIYQWYPVLLIFWSLGSNAVHLALEARDLSQLCGYKNSVLETFKRLATSPLHIIILTLNMSLLAFAIIAILQHRGYPYSLFFLLLIPLPPVFYILTSGLSRPSVLSHT